MNPHELFDGLSALGGFGGLAATLTGVATLITARRAKSNTDELKPDHGSLVADKIDVVVTQVQGIDQMVRSQGHQMGEIRDDLHATREDLRDERTERRSDSEEIKAQAKSEHDRIWAELKKDC